LAVDLRKRRFGLILDSRVLAFIRG